MDDHKVRFGCGPTRGYQRSALRRRHIEAIHQHDDFDDRGGLNPAFVNERRQTAFGKAQGPIHGRVALVEGAAGGDDAKRCGVHLRALPERDGSVPRLNNRRLS